MNKQETTYQELLLALPPEHWIDAMVEAFEIAESFGVCLEASEDDEPTLRLLATKNPLALASIGWDVVFDCQRPVR